MLIKWKMDQGAQCPQTKLPKESQSLSPLTLLILTLTLLNLSFLLFPPLAPSLFSSFSVDTLNWLRTSWWKEVARTLSSQPSGSLKTEGALQCEPLSLQMKSAIFWRREKALPISHIRRWEITRFLVLDLVLPLEWLWFLATEPPEDGSNCPSKGKALGAMRSHLSKRLKQKPHILVVAFPPLIMCKSIQYQF